VALDGRDVGSRDAAIDQERRAGDERGFVRGEEERRVGDLVGLSEATHRHVDQAALALLFGLLERANAGSVGTASTMGARC